MTWEQLNNTIYELYDTGGATEIFDYTVVVGASPHSPITSYAPVRSYDINHERQEIVIYA